MDWAAITLTGRLSACASIALLILGLPIAWWLANTRWRGRVFIEAFVALPLVLPPTVLGYYVLVALGPRTWLGQTYQQLSGHTLPFSFEGLLVASILYSLPFAVQPFTAGFRSIDPHLIQASLNVGASPWRTFWKITVPLAWPGIISGMVLSFAHTLGEFGVVLMVGGNIPNVTRTVSISIYDHVQSLDYASATRTSVFLLVVSFAVLSVTYALQRNFRFTTLLNPK
jgi:molybdate transport system permease protein